MKKILATLACGAVIASMAAADGMRIEGGAGIWQQKSSGDASYTEAGYDGKYDSKEDTYNQSYVWLMIKHPIPILPNLRVEYVGIEDKGNVSGKFKDYDAGNIAKAKYDMKQYDIIPYYNILDNTGWTTVDIGIDLKVADAKYEAYDVTDNDTGLITNYSDSSSVVVPLLYVRARVEFPYGMAVEGNAKYIGYGKAHIIDTIAKFDYTMEFVPVVHPAIEVGYRYQSYKYDEDGEDTSFDLKFSGFYAGIMLRY